MPTLNQVKIRCKGVFNGYQNQIINRQQAYINSNNRAFQGLSIISAIPAHTTASYNDLEPDELDRKPQGKTTSWNGYYNGFDRPSPITVLCDEYITPSGEYGCVVIGYFRYNGDLYVIAQNGIGPEDWRTVPDWTKVTI